MNLCDVTGCVQPAAVVVPVDALVHENRLEANGDASLCAGHAESRIVTDDTTVE